MEDRIADIVIGGFTSMLGFIGIRLHMRQDRMARDVQDVQRQVLTNKTEVHEHFAKKTDVDKVQEHIDKRFDHFDAKLDKITDALYNRTK